MPLKIICKHCGKIMYQTFGQPRNSYRTNRYYSNLLDLSVPDIVDRKLNFKCPSCGRTILPEDLKAWTLKILLLKNLRERTHEPLGTLQKMR